MTITTTPYEAFQMLEMDIVGPLPESSLKNKYILTMLCKLTKYSLAIPLPNDEAKTIANAFAEEFICRFGCPEEIYTDQGSNFLSKTFKTLAKIFKINKFNSTSWHPESMGNIERSHATLVDYLKCFIYDNEWDKLLKYACFSFNTSVHESTKYTPHELVFGKPARLPSE